MNPVSSLGGICAHMKFFEDTIAQELKHGQLVCGDACICERDERGTVVIICDGIGSGMYANIAAVSCVARLKELLNRDVSLRAAAEMVAASMHKAREAEIPFSAFSAASISQDGHFNIYTYESPPPVRITDGSAQALDPDFYTAGYEVVGEVSGTLDIGDSLVLFSDGVSQAGLGHGYAWGIGSEGVAAFIDKELAGGKKPTELPGSINAMAASVSGGSYEDDATCVLIHCREATQLTLLTGPPSRAAKDSEYVRDFMAMPGAKAVCGSTTTEIVARELKREARLCPVDASLGSPPEYLIDGIDMVTEGAVMLNQAYNLLDEPAENLTDGVVERLCKLMLKADAVHFMLGGAGNVAHSGILFKQIGLLPRKNAVRLIAEKLKSLGKLVTVKTY